MDKFRGLLHPGTSLLLATVSVSILGCSAGSPFRQEPIPDDLLKLHASNRASQLYLRSMPYDSLYVEIDWVEGCEPNTDTIEEMQRFLSHYCEKPGGIQVVVGRPIPKAESFWGWFSLFP